MLLADAQGTPLGLLISSASPHEVTLIEPLLEQSQLRLPARTRLLYDKAADSQSLRRRLRWGGITLVCPYIRRRHRRQRMMNGRQRQHYRSRWKIERTIGWLKNLRRLTTRWERHVHLHLGFWQLGCLFTILKTF